MTSPQRAPRRFRAVWTTLLTAMLSVSGALVALPAAAAAGYVGEDADGFNSEWDNGGNRTIPLMVSGQPYSATVVGPQYYPSSYDWSISDGELPTGLSLSTGYSPSVTISGTPQFDGELWFQLTATQNSEYSRTLTFSGTIESGKTATTTVVTSGALYGAASVAFSATVTAVDSSTLTGGTVQFALDGTNVGSPVAVDSDGVAVLTTLVDASFAGDPTITAHYSGNDDYAESSGTRSVTVYASNTVGGVIAINGAPQEGLTVTLTPVAATPGDSATTTTLADGTYSFTVPVTTVDDATRLYTITAAFDGDTERSWNTAGNQVDADETGPMTWTGSPHNITLAVPPVWTDTDITQPRRGSAYSSNIAAQGGSIEYTVTAGDLPLGLSLGFTSGIIEGTPDCAPPAAADEGCTYSFTVTASNGYGSVTHVFTGSILRPGVPPTWAPTSPTEWDLQETIEFTGAVAAEGDPDISYSVHSGDLPSGISLDSVTGVVTGTPACTTPIAPTDPCEYSVTIRATNTYGSVDRTFTGTIAAAPEIDLVLEFSAGTPLDLAESTISGSGLKVDSTYTLEMFSAPVLLYTGTIDATGGFSWQLGLPAGTPVGPHRLLLTGIAPDGSVMTAEAWFTLLANGRIGGISYTGAVAMPGLASTGTDVTLPLTSALVLTLLGAALMSRRRFLTRH